MLLSKPLKNAHKPMLLALLLHVLMLTACAHNSPVCPPESPQLPTPPSVSTQQPQVPYSESASANIKRWQDRLTSTQMMRD